MQFETIAVPVEWDADRDLKAYLARHGESDDYFGDQLDRVFMAFDRLERAIDRSFVYFRLCQSTPLNSPIPRKLEALRRHVLADPASGSHRDKLFHRFGAVLIVLSEYARIVSESAEHKEDTWLWPLIELEDRLAQSADELETAMFCAYRDFIHRADLPERL